MVSSLKVRQVLYRVWSGVWWFDRFPRSLGMVSNHSNILRFSLLTQIVPDIHLSTECPNLNDGLTKEIIRLSLQSLFHSGFDVIILIPHTYLDAIGRVVALTVKEAGRELGWIDLASSITITASFQPPKFHQLTTLEKEKENYSRLWYLNSKWIIQAKGFQSLWIGRKWVVISFKSSLASYAANCIINSNRTTLGLQKQLVAPSSESKTWSW